MIMYTWLLYFSTIRPNTASMFAAFVSTLFVVICGAGVDIGPDWGDCICIGKEVDAAAVAAVDITSRIAI